jgi:peptidoglycan/xylan/chitin deacetylase (PgdA/CDA1 family)
MMMAIVAAASGSLIIRNRAGSAPRIRVLTYHRFGEARHDPFCVTADEFDRQMAWLSEQKLAVSLSQLVDFLDGKTPLPNGGVLVTIDDGCPSVLSTALPVLQRYRVPSVVFVPADEIGRSGAASPETPESRMTWEQLTRLVAAGVMVGAHGWRHVSFGRLAPAVALEHAIKARAALESAIRQPIVAFAYPFGTRADFNDATTHALRAAGFRLAFTSQHGAVLPNNDPLLLPRVKVEGGEGLWMFRLLVRGGLDAWNIIDRSMWRLQASEA